MRIVLYVGMLCGLFALAGCGSKDEAAGFVPVSGNITVNGNPTGNVLLTFVPQGQKGLLPGKYKVVASRRLNPDGSPPDPNTPPIESNARETLPAKYSDENKTELTLNIAAGDKRSFDFAVQTGKK